MRELCRCLGCDATFSTVYTLWAIKRVTLSNCCASRHRTPPVAKLRSSMTDHDKHRSALANVVVEDRLSASGPVAHLAIRNKIHLKRCSIGQLLL